MPPRRTARLTQIAKSIAVAIVRDAPTSYLPLACDLIGFIIKCSALNPVKAAWELVERQCREEFSLAVHEGHLLRGGFEALVQRCAAFESVFGEAFEGQWLSDTLRKLPPEKILQNIAEDLLWVKQKRFVWSALTSELREMLDNGIPPTEQPASNMTSHADIQIKSRGRSCLRKIRFNPFSWIDSVHRKAAAVTASETKEVIGQAVAGLAGSRVLMSTLLDYLHSSKLDKAANDQTKEATKAMISYMLNEALKMLDRGENWPFSGKMDSVGKVETAEAQKEPSVSDTVSDDTSSTESTKNPRSRVAESTSRRGTDFCQTQIAICTGQDSAGPGAGSLAATVEQQGLLRLCEGPEVWQKIVGYVVTMSLKDEDPATLLRNRESYETHIRDVLGLWVDNLAKAEGDPTQICGQAIARVKHFLSIDRRPTFERRTSVDGAFIPRYKAWTNNVVTILREIIHRPSLHQEFPRFSRLSAILSHRSTNARVRGVYDPYSREVPSICLPVIDSGSDFPNGTAVVPGAAGSVTTSPTSRQKRSIETGDATSPESSHVSTAKKRFRASRMGTKSFLSSGKIEDGQSDLTPNPQTVLASSVPPPEGDIVVQQGQSSKTVPGDKSSLDGQFEWDPDTVSPAVGLQSEMQSGPATRTMFDFGLGDVTQAEWASQFPGLEFVDIRF